MTPRTAAVLAMPIAGVMIAHQVAGKAVRDAMFLTAWPASRLPAMVIATALVVVAAVPVYSWLMERLGPRLVVSLGFLGSAAAHLVEWRLTGRSGWVAVLVYLHVAGFTGLLLSGFWSVISEIFEPRTARVAYGRIAAAGTMGGLVGGLSVARLASTHHEASALVMLALLHAMCAAGVAAIAGGARVVRSAARPDGRGRVFEFDVLRRAPHLRTLAAIIVLGAAGAIVADYLLKMRAVEAIGTGATLLRFFASFYLVVQVATFLTQLAVSHSVRRLGLGRTMSVLPAGVGGIGVLGLLYQTFPMFVTIRGVEAVFRGSLFRAAYELIFVPMAPSEKRRAKTFLDVTCDRAGDAAGALVVQALLLTSAAYLSGELLAAMIAMAGVSVWLGTRLDALYLGVVERRLTHGGSNTPVFVASETGWTVVNVAPLSTAEPPAAAPALRPVTRGVDPKLARLVELRSGDRTRVERALDALTDPDALDVAQVIHLLAWDDVAAHAGKALDRIASAHIGIIGDALLDPRTDFAIRRRLPRVLGTLPERRALDGLVGGLDDPRFEVRYQCGRAMSRLLAQHTHLGVDAARIMTIVDRELSVSPQVWHGYRLLDHADRDDTGISPPGGTRLRNLEHVFTLLATVFPPEPVGVALHGIQSDDAGLRAVAVEYLEGVLPAPLLSRLWHLLEVMPATSAGGAPAQSDPPR